MAKRRIPGETAHATPRPRRKQAVTKTNSGKIKTLIRQNATNSPLLSLPSEVREKILVNMIGDNLIHVKYLSSHDLAKAKGISWDELHEADPKLAEGGAFRHAICVATKSEQDAYDETVLGNAEVPEDEDPDYFTASCKKRHEGCRMSQGGSKRIYPEEHGVLTIDLKVLGACRQLYEESNYLLWATNTFSFDDANSLNKFLASLNPAQKRNLSGIHISAEVDHAQIARWWCEQWSLSLKMSYINMLRGVQNLHLCFQQALTSVPQFPQTYDELYEKCKKGLDRDIKPFLRLRALNTKNATVVLNDDPSEWMKIKNQVLFRWDTTAKNQYAENIRAQLTAPNGAELVRSDAEVANAANEVANMNNAKLDVSRAEFRVNRAAEEAAAARAESSDAEGDFLDRLVTTLQGKLIQAVVKYERAKARVEAREAKNRVQRSNTNREKHDEDLVKERNDGDVDDGKGLKGWFENADEDRDIGFGLKEDLNNGEEADQDEQGMLQGKDEQGEWEQHHKGSKNEETKAIDEDDEMDDESY